MRRRIERTLYCVSMLTHEQEGNDQAALGSQSLFTHCLHIHSLTRYRQSTGKARALEQSFHVLGHHPWACEKLACLPIVRLTNHSQLGSKHQRNPDGEANHVIPDGVDDGSNLLVPSAPQNAATGTLWTGDIHQYEQSWCS